MKPKLYRFSYGPETMRGFVFAQSESEAIEKMLDYLEFYGHFVDLTGEDDNFSLSAWEWTSDDYYDIDHPDVLNLYAI